MKTKEEILGSFHDQAMGKLFESKINLSLAESQVLIIKPGDEYNNLQKKIVTLKQSVKNFEKMLEIIKSMFEFKEGKEVVN